MMNIEHSLIKKDKKQKKDKSLLNQHNRKLLI
jgi:hypothetical protein